MSKLKHSPGPWFVSDEYTGIVVDSDGLRVAAAYKDKPYEPHDARLIAAAPELLEALERIINDDRAAVDRDDYLFAKEAIAKAKGE